MWFIEMSSDTGKILGFRPVSCKKVRDILKNVKNDYLICKGRYPLIDLINACITD